MRHTDVRYLTIKQNVKQWFGFGALFFIFFYDAAKVIFLWALVLFRRR